MDILAIETQLNEKFKGEEHWNVNPYLSPSEKASNKPILPGTNPATNRMGHPRNYPGPDTPLLEAEFMSFDGRWHTACYTTVEDALVWLLRQDPSTGQVNV